MNVRDMIQELERVANNTQIKLENFLVIDYEGDAFGGIRAVEEYEQVEFYRPEHDKDRPTAAQLLAALKALPEAQQEFEVVDYDGCSLGIVGRTHDSSGNNATEII